MGAIINFQIDLFFASEIGFFHIIEEKSLYQKNTEINWLLHTSINIRHSKQSDLEENKTRKVVRSVTTRFLTFENTEIAVKNFFIRSEVNSEQVKNNYKDENED